MQNLTAQILAAIKISHATAITVAAGLSLMAFAFVGFVITQGVNAAKGRIGETEKSKRKDDDE